MSETTLKKYKSRRHFSATPEPEGGIAKGWGRSGRKTRHFVVQKHDASQLHFDFRLEMDGVLKSWAVPKGPSLDPENKRLAIRTEDHPLAYADFEGVIPEGQYGGGAVMIWDRGEWRSEETTPLKALRDGKLRFELKGERLQGHWSLIRMAGSGDVGDNWLLIKSADDRQANRGDPVKTETKSIASGRSLDQIRAAAKAGKGQD